jgi:hypothetical protein
MAATWLTIAAIMALGQNVSPSETDRESLRMTPGVVCSKVEGFGRYVARERPEVDRNEKLLIYYQPIGHAYERRQSKYHVRMIEDVKIRPRGKKDVLWKKEKLGEFEKDFDDIPTNLYLYNTIAVKGLAPGEYDLVIELHDELSGHHASQIVAFRVVDGGGQERDSGQEKPSPRPTRAGGGSST